MDEFTITVNIADRNYRIRIQRDNEEMIRNAAKMLNTSVQNYAKNYAYSDKQDLLALAALQFASEVDRLNRSIKSEESILHGRLAAIDAEIDNKLEQYRQFFDKI